MDIDANMHVNVRIVLGAVQHVLHSIVYVLSFMLLASFVIRTG